MSAVGLVPVIPDELLAEVANNAGVCSRPVVRQVTDETTGSAELIAIPCGSTRERVCPPCAAKARRLRMQQCRDGWHRIDDPAAVDDEDQDDEEDDQEAEPPAGDDDEGPSVRRRSTKRRPEFPPLPPKIEPENRSVGCELRSPNGKTYRPSMFLTLTLPSYGRVRRDGTPVDPDSYDYRRAALDAIHFPKLVDRFWQNLRRCAGFKVQYFAAIEPQRRLALHLHAAVRGVVPRKLLRQIVAATYEQVWWPPYDDPIYVDRLPVWDDELERYVDPDDGVILPTWDDAIDATYEPGARPAHLLWFGDQVDSQWFIPDSSRTDKRIGYLCKYLTKSVADTYDPDTAKARQLAHMDRLHAEVRWLPCSPECANWLRFGIQPKDAEPDLIPGHCIGTAHDRHNLGFGGRRVQVSRDWSGKTLSEHKADRAAVVHAALAEIGIDAPDIDRYAADQTTDDGKPRYRWGPPPTDVDAEHRAAVVRQTVTEALVWREQYAEAKARATARALNHPPDDRRSATHPPDAAAAAPPRKENAWTNC